MIEKNFEGVSVRWVIALKGEAEEIIKNYAMKRVETTPFPVYKNKDLDMWLILSGIGQLNAVAATSYLYVKSDASYNTCLLYTSPSPRDRTRSRMPSSA